MDKILDRQKEQEEEAKKAKYRRGEYIPTLADLDNWRNEEWFKRF